MRTLATIACERLQRIKGGKMTRIGARRNGCASRVDWRSRRATRAYEWDGRFEDNTREAFERVTGRSRTPHAIGTGPLVQRQTLWHAHVAFGHSRRSPARDD